MRNKIVIVGPSGAGKTTFFNKCTSKDFIFQDDHSPTEFLDEKFVTRQVDGNQIKFNIVDTVGSAIFGEVITAGNIFRNVRMILCLFDVSSHLSFEEFSCRKERFENLKAEIGLKQGEIHLVDFILVGAKCDKEHRVTQSEVEAFVNTLSTPVDGNSTECINFFRLDRKYFTCSAKMGYDIDTILDFIATTLASDTRGEPDDLRTSSTVRLVDEKKKKKKHDCNCGSVH